MPVVESSADLTTLASRLREVIVLLSRMQRADAVDRFTPTQLSTIGSIRRHGPISVGDLANRERLSVPTISKVVAELERQGVIERLADPRDRRVSRLVMSDAGAEWIMETRSKREQRLAQRLRALTSRERAAVVAALPALENLLLDDE